MCSQSSGSRRPACRIIRLDRFACPHRRLQTGQQRQQISAQGTGVDRLGLGSGGGPGLDGGDDHLPLRGPPAVQGPLGGFGASRDLPEGDPAVDARLTQTSRTTRRIAVSRTASRGRPGARRAAGVFKYDTVRIVTGVRLRCHRRNSARGWSLAPRSDTLSHGTRHRRVARRSHRERLHRSDPGRGGWRMPVRAGIRNG